MTARCTPGDAIRLRGVRHNNLKNFDLDIPIGKLTVITGLSGSGKSSLAFDTLFAEGQRRYIETFSPYARQFFDRLDKPQVDRIEGIPPAIAIEQRNAVRSTRSTVGTMTEICDYLKVLWPHLARLHCRQCHRVVRPEPPQVVWDRVGDELRRAKNEGPPGELLVTFDLPLSEKLSLAESLELIARQGYQRLLIQERIARIDEAAALLGTGAKTVTVIQDRLKIAPAQRARFVEACEQAYHFGKGKLAVRWLERRTGNAAAGDSTFDIRQSSLFSLGHHCAECDLDYAEPSPALFSFNHPLGACPECKGFGRIIRIDYQLALPDRSRTLAEGAIKPWQSGMSAECQTDLLKACRQRGVPTDVPFEQLPEQYQRWVIDGEAGYDSNDPANSWPEKWYGVRGYFRWLESKSYKMHVRVLLSRYRAYTTCESCGGQRLKPEAIRYRLPVPGEWLRPGSRAGKASPDGAWSLSLPEFYALSIDHALAVINQLATTGGRPASKAAAASHDPLTLALGEVRTRLRYLVEVGLGYITLDRPTRTLSGGETERVNLTTCLGTRLVNTLFVLDEPSVGLHPRDTERLVRILEQLRDTGNTVVVVEHEAGVIQAADQVVDLGPGQGENGGQLVFAGPLPALLRCPKSLTGQYLSGRRRIEIPERRPVHGFPGGPEAGPEPAANGWQLGEATIPYRSAAAAVAAQAPRFLRVSNATRHNLKNVTVDIPLGRFVALTGVSGSGKTTLVRDILLPSLQARLAPRRGGAIAVKASDRLDHDSDAAASTDESGDRDPVSGARLVGWDSLESVVLVDQSALGKTPRSNPVVYIGAFDDVRELYARTDLARQRGLNSSSFSFNSGVGQCERCRGAGFEKIEMQFLSDVFIRCPECAGRRYREHILEVKLRGSVARSRRRAQLPKRAMEGGREAAERLVTDWSIADMLEATVDDAVEFLGSHLHVPAGRRAVARLKLLQDVGLGYLRLGQPINTLSGGESQRLKLVSHLAESDLGSASEMTEDEGVALKPRNTTSEVRQWLSKRGRKSSGAERTDPGEERPGSTPAARRGTLFLFDEPTTGLHFDDVRLLLQVFQRIVDAGHSVVVIEHNLDVIQCADWVIELGPEAGDAGGQVVVTGTPEEVADCEISHTGHYLRERQGCVDRGMKREGESGVVHR